MARQVPRWGPGTCTLECDSRGLRSTLMASPARTGTAPFLCVAGHRPPRRPRGRAEANVPATAWPPGQMPRDWLPAKRTIVLSFGRRLTTCVHRHTHTRIQARTPHTLSPDIHTRSCFYWNTHVHIYLGTRLHDNTRAHRSPSSEAAGAERATGRSWKGSARSAQSSRRQARSGNGCRLSKAEVRELKKDARVRGEQNLKSPARSLLGKHGFRSEPEKPRLNFQARPQGLTDCAPHTAVGHL